MSEPGLTPPQEWERCRDAARIAEQGAELGATADNKLDKRKKLEEEAGGKAVEAENHYRLCVDDANARHRNLLGVKSRVLQQIRELLMQADQTMKAVTVSYFQQQHTLTAPCPVQFQVSCQLGSRLVWANASYISPVISPVWQDFFKEMLLFPLPQGIDFTDVLV